MHVLLRNTCQHSIECKKVCISLILFEFRRNTYYSSQARKAPPKEKQTIRKLLAWCCLELWADVLHIFFVYCSFSFSFFMNRTVLGLVIVSSIFIAPSHILDPIFVLQICCHKSVGSFDSLDVLTFSFFNIFLSSSFLEQIVSTLLRPWKGHSIKVKCIEQTKSNTTCTLQFNSIQCTLWVFVTPFIQRMLLVSFPITIFMDCTANMVFDDS